MCMYIYSQWCHVCRILFTVIWQNAWITLETFTRCLTQLFRFLWYILVYVSNRLLTNLIISCLSEFDWFNSFQCLCKIFFFQMKWLKFDYHWVTLCLDIYMLFVFIHSAPEKWPILCHSISADRNYQFRSLTNSWHHA